MKYLFYPVLLTLSFVLPLQGGSIGQNWIIHCRPQASAMEEYAAEMLQKYIEKASGMKLPITSKYRFPAVKVAFDPNLNREEHLVKVLENGDLLVSGGFPGGVIYGALEFLEKVMNCRFLAPDEEYVPQLQKIAFPDDLCLRGAPPFLRRRISPGPGVRRKLMDYMIKRRLSGYFVKSANVDPYRFGNSNGHAFHLLSLNFPQKRTDFFSLDAAGKRLRSVSTAGPGQLCLTHPQVRDLLFRNMIQMISKHKKAAAAVKPYLRQVPNYIYSLGKNDNRDDCLCAECRKKVKEYKGNHAGLTMDFVSDIARRAGKIHKDVLFSFLAYTSDEIPLQNYRLPENVMVIVPQLGSEFMTLTNRDSMRSLYHPINKKAKESLCKWRKSAAHLGIWDYWCIYRQLYSVPMTNVSALIDNIRFYAELKVENYYAETQTIFTNLLSFTDLRWYVASTLLADPARDTEKLIAEFMELYYGKAAPPMTRYLNYLEKRMQEEKNPFGITAPALRSYLDKAFYHQAEKFFAEAEKAVADSPKHLRRIGQERIFVDQWVLAEHKRLGIKADLKKIAARLKSNHRICAARYTDAVNAKKWVDQADAFIESCLNSPPLPRDFTRKKFYDFWGPKLRRHSTLDKKVNDPDSPTGSAWCLGAVSKEFHKKELEFALYDWVGKKHLLKKKVQKKDYPQDEKYHWYKVGKTKLTARTQLACHWSWKLSQKSGNDVFDPLEPDAEYEIYVSIKLTGPSYVKNSTKSDGVWLDRVVFTEVERSL